MNAQQIDNMISRMPKLVKKYYGTFASDTLCLPERYPACCIVNLGKSREREIKGIFSR
jgi:hypothetical protein